MRGAGHCRHGAGCYFGVRCAGLSKYLCLIWCRAALVDTLHHCTERNNSALWVLVRDFSIIGIGLLKHALRQRTHWRRVLHTWLLRMPVAGPLTRHTCTARWTRTLATLFSAGVPLTEALEAVQDVTGHLLFQTATHNIQAQLIQGRSLSSALESTQGLFPMMVVQMCAIGEESGALDHMLEKTAEHYEREVESTVARLSTLLEPFIMVVLGVLIGGLVMALYLPIFNWGRWYDVGHGHCLWIGFADRQLCECADSSPTKDDHGRTHARDWRTLLQFVAASVSLPALPRSTQSLAQHAGSQLRVPEGPLRILRTQHQSAIPKCRARHRFHLVKLHLALGLQRNGGVLGGLYDDAAGVICD